jgi:hypothetical protein
LGPLDGAALGALDGADLKALDGAALGPLDGATFAETVDLCSGAAVSPPEDKACSPSTTMTLPQVLQRIRRIFDLTFSSAIE